MTSKKIMEKIGVTPMSVRDVQDNYKLMLYALIEIGLDWEGNIKAFPEKTRPVLTLTQDLEWLSGILKQVTGMTWGELTNDK